jgi:hypothetical protein
MTDFNPQPDEFDAHLRTLRDAIAAVYAELRADRGQLHHSTSFALGQLLGSLTTEMFWRMKTADSQPQPFRGAKECGHWVGTDCDCGP